MVELVPSAFYTAPHKAMSDVITALYDTRLHELPQIRRILGRESTVLPLVSLLPEQMVEIEPRGQVASSRMDKT